MSDSAIKLPYKINKNGSMYFQESDKDTVILLSKKDSTRPIKSKYLNILDRNENDEPGN